MVALAYEVLQHNLGNHGKLTMLYPPGLVGAISCVEDPSGNATLLNPYDEKPIVIYSTRGNDFRGEQFHINYLLTILIDYLIQEKYKYLIIPILVLSRYEDLLAMLTTNDNVEHVRDIGYKVAITSVPPDHEPVGSIVEPVYTARLMVVSRK